MKSARDCERRRTAIPIETAEDFDPHPSVLLGVAKWLQRFRATKQSGGAAIGVTASEHAFSVA
jgi:hypothetical protein